MPAPDNLDNLEYLGMGYVNAQNRLRRLRTANQIVRARNHATGLDRELPLLGVNYPNTFKAMRRMNRTASLTQNQDYFVDVIFVDDKAVGMATAQVLQPKPVRLGTQAVELSYWHEDAAHTETAVSLGVATMRRLLDRAQNVQPEASHAWMVTLPDDAIKPIVLEASGFEGVEDPQRYYIDDNVTEDRQLWHAELS